jgi:signal transduction histidine kinase
LLGRLHAIRTPQPRFLAIVLGGVLIAWIVLILSVDQLQFVVVAPTAKAGFEVFLALLRLFTALVLFLFPDELSRPRLRWVGLGFLVLGLGGLGFGYFAPLLHAGMGLNEVMYGALIARTIASAVMVVGLVPEEPPNCSAEVMGLVIGIFILLSVILVVAEPYLPPLVISEPLETAVTGDSNFMRGLTGWHWALSLVPLVLSLAAAIGAIRHPITPLGWWLVVALVLLAGSQLHALFWPSAFSPILTTASILNLGSTLAIGTGAFFALRRVAAERATRLAAEQQYTAQLQELSTLRADFSAMVAHELGSPIAAIRQASELLATGPLDPLQARARSLIETEVKVLTTLVADIQAVATIESDAFVVQPRAVPLVRLLNDGADFARTLPGNHPVKVEADREAQVLADPERIGQVLRNLLSNAAKYSPSGTQITLRSQSLPGQVQIEVVDQGPGIDPEDLEQIFAKFGRGRQTRQHGVAGLGLGLYLSRRIVQAHGADLTVCSTPGQGSVFAFPLEVVR